MIERRIVRGLIDHLSDRGFEITKVDEGEEVITSDPVEAMEAIFSVDDCCLYVRKPMFKSHWIQIVLGNGIDCIVDYSYMRDDGDGFDKAMQDFEEEKFV